MNIAKSIAFEGALISSQALLEKSVAQAEARDGSSRLPPTGNPMATTPNSGTAAWPMPLKSRPRTTIPGTPIMGLSWTRIRPPRKWRSRPGRKARALPGVAPMGWVMVPGLRLRDGREGKAGTRNGGAPCAGLSITCGTRVNLYFEVEKGKLFKDPWAARNDYIYLILDPKASRGEFLERHAGRSLSPEEKVRALTHLEIQRNATSCIRAAAGSSATYRALRPPR